MQHRIINVSQEIENAEGQPVTELSFKPFLNYVRLRLKDRDTIKREIYQLILHKFDKYPELESPIAVTELGKYKELLNLLYMVLSSVVDDEKTTRWALSTPVTPQIFYGTDSMYEFMLAAGTQKINDNLLYDKETLRRQKCEKIYSIILERFYHFKFNSTTEIVREIFDKEAQLQKYYRFNLDTRFIDITTTHPLPDLNLQDLQIHLHEDEGMEILQKVLPMKMFRFTGFAIITVTDVTTEYAIEKLRDILVNGHSKVDEESYGPVVGALKAIAGTSALEFGLLPILRVNDKLVEDFDAYSHSILFSLGKRDGVMKNFFLPLVEKFLATPRMVYYPDLDVLAPTQQQVGELLKLAGIKSFAMLPVYYNTKLIGAFEIHSKEKGLLDERVLTRLESSMPLVAQLMQNSVEEFSARINDTIRSKFTSLQPSVQWRFNEAAWEYLSQSKKEGKLAPLEKIEFRKVYPLYGAIDVRNSTINRNNAVLNDLRKQFAFLQDALGTLKGQIGIGLTDEIIFKCNRWQPYLQDVLTTNDEIRLNQFLAEEAHPFLEHFRETHPDTSELINQYFRAIEPETGEAWKNRRDLEESMQVVNDAINNYLDLMNVEIQQAYPCYFEKFRTDGLEYDIYLGQAITPHRKFDVVYLKNLRLWQLGSMAAIARLSHLLRPKMTVPLETTQLIFIYSNTIDISFRVDERRFDVEGGYNIRYHIIKKRIDKVHIKGTRERLTQPGKIALIYFNEKDAEEYISYIQHLQEKKVLLDDMESLELEELQGVTGLKALRVGVDVNKNAE
jgi:hypothetical protein